MKRIAIKVPVIESERGWGAKIDDYMVCLDSEAAKAFIIEFNSKNTESKTPDWYMYADSNINSIELTGSQFTYLVNNGNTWLSILNKK